VRREATQFAVAVTCQTGQCDVPRSLIGRSEDKLGRFRVHSVQIKLGQIRWDELRRDERTSVRNCDASQIYESDDCSFLLLGYIFQILLGVWH